MLYVYINNDDTNIKVTDQIYNNLHIAHETVTCRSPQ
jgi:hypothetical protein